MKKPNFFIIGAPKCGTTSMDIWLSEHPLIYMAKKEPSYFNTDDHKFRNIMDEAGYRALFTAATDAHLVIGESSVHYLYSQDAVANILNYEPNAKFIVMLRNPIDMVYSLHNHAYFGGFEDVKDFANAWHLQEPRLSGRRRCLVPRRLQYGAICRLGEQLQRLYKQVSSDRVHLVFFDDLQQNSRQVYQSGLSFLGVADNHKQNFNIHNVARVHRIHLLRNVPRWLGEMKRGLGISSNFGVSEFIRTRNEKNQTRQPLSRDMRRTLIDYFSDDVALLAQLSHRDLTHWLQ